VPADVGETGGRTGAGRIGSALRLLLPVGIDRLREPVLARHLEGLLGGDPRTYLIERLSGLVAGRE
jgi:hypothetical protein